MDLWEIILFFWAPISRHIGYFKDLNNNVETLKRKTEKLKRKHDDIQAEVDNAIPVGKRQKALVENWLTEVRNTENEVDSIRLELERRRICTYHWSRYTLGKRVVEKLEDIKKLKGVFHEVGESSEVAESSRHPRVLEKQTSLPRGQQSTFERTLEEIWQCLHEEENGVIGIYGIGGIDKTTLMKEVNNRCTKTRDFDVVIWITVSNYLNFGLIQEEIGNRLGMKFQNEDKRDKLFARLKNLRYLLILDDLGEAFSLVQVGIPNPDKQNRCKIAITSQSVAVCNAMGADKSINVGAPKPAVTVCNAMGADKSINVRALTPESSRHPRVKSEHRYLPSIHSSIHPSRMDLWEIILFFWAPISRHIGYFKDLDNNVETLKRKTEKLKRKHDEIQAEVDNAIPVGKRQKAENWLTKVRNTENEVDSIRLELEQRRICTYHWSRYTLGKRVVEKLEDIKKLKGVFQEVAESSRHPRVLEKQTSLPRGQQSTSKRTLEEIWQCLHEEENGIIGICGMGGIGKTTLMKEINNRCTKTRDFDVVIWITVSKDLNLGLIQEEIGNRLGMKFDGNEEKGDKLFARLKNLRYLLILDDLWKSFSLVQVGIPKPDKQNRCKMAITSRSVAVCKAMGACKSIKVRYLTPEEAWNLFSEICGDVVLSSEILPVAEKVVEECGGLPLAIKTVGRAMCGNDKKQEWRYALRALEGASPEVPGMAREVFLPLKLSYDSLENDKMESYFLYCSLFPKDYDIKIDELVRCWAVEEGFLENVNNLEEASDKGHHILERIKDVCLLEEGRSGNGYVRMHYLLRDLAIWITSPSSSIEGSKFLVKAGEGLEQPPEEKMWRGVVRISLMRSKIKDLEISPACPNLISLFLNENYHLRTIHSNFFQLMPKLQILDLSLTGIESLPMSLLQLVNLRVLILSFCRNLVEVPPLGKLKELQILDLSESGLKNFPQGIESLVKLKRLDISSTSLTAIPYTMIFGLTSLEEVSMMHLEENVDGATFSEAVNMKRLRSLRISLSNLNGFIANDMFHRWFSGLTSFHVAVNYTLFPILSNKNIVIRDCDKFPCGIEGLTKYAFSLYLYETKGLTSLSKFQGDLKSLREIQVEKCSGVECFIDWREVGDDAFQCLQRLDLDSLQDLEKVFDGGAPPPLNTSLQNLRIIRVNKCEKLRSLFSSSMVEQLHQLEELRIAYCFQMKEIIEGDKLPHNSFPKLRILELDHLPEVESICSQRFMFISLEEIYVSSCGMLKMLPLFSSSIHEIKGKIEGKREWWEGLEWEDEKARSRCSTIYKEASSEVEEEDSSE